VNGKGSTRRPQQVTDQEMVERWAATFGEDAVDLRTDRAGEPRVTANDIIRLFERGTRA
jgi:hypothetical protein